jgi:hypothetical protein
VKLAATFMMLKELADNTSSRSLATRLRRKRFALFLRLIDRLEGEVHVLDVGGTHAFWTMMGLTEGRVRVTVLNLEIEESERRLGNVIPGDARDMRSVRDKQFDVAFSNSVIEHVGTLADQGKMASEVRRVATRYFVQTPNKYFPIEPHFLVPGFQFLPLSARAALLARRDLGWYKRAESYAAALNQVAAVRLLTKRELRRLFPEAQLYQERFLGLTKSFVVYHGWE